MREGIGVHAGALADSRSGISRTSLQVHAGRHPDLRRAQQRFRANVQSAPGRPPRREGGNLRRHVVVLESPIGADQETKVRQSRITHRPSSNRPTLTSMSLPSPDFSPLRLFRPKRGGAPGRVTRPGPPALTATENPWPLLPEADYFLWYK